MNALRGTAVMIALTAGGCSSTTDTDTPDPPPDSVASVILAVHDLVTVPGAFVQVPALITDTAGRSLPVPPAFSSTAPAVATVDTAGGIRVLGPGTVRIVARFNTRADTLRLTSAAVRYADLAVGPQFACGVTVADDVYCWGNVGLFDSLFAPDAMYIGPRAPVRIATRTGIQSLVAGLEHLCVVAGGSAACRGSNTLGMLGQGAADSVFHPDLLQVPGSALTALGAGYFFTCGLQAGGAAWCWGYNGYGELGDSSSGNIRPAPVAVRGSHAFQALTGGLQHACGLDADSVAWCWGEGSSGAVGPETGACPQVLSDLRCTVPVPVDTAMRFLALAAGWAHTCGVDRSGVGWCWGLGYGSQPVALSGSQIFVGVVAGAGHSCALDDSDGAWCWGDNGAGQLGIGQVGTASPDPVPVTGGLTFALLRAGGSVTCGLTPAGRAWCWGNHTDGAVGDGSDFSIQLRPAPVEVAGQLP